MVNPHTADDPKGLGTPNAEADVVVTPDELPVHCPLPGRTLWNSHPRVYIPLDDPGDTARCPYCGALYRLEATQ